MRKFIVLTIVALACAFGMKAEVNHSIGVQLIGATSVPQLGLNGKWQLELPYNLRVEPEIMWLFRNKTQTTWNLGANLHYVFKLVPRFNIYPIVGVGYGRYIHTVDDWSKANKRIYVNLGAGAEFNVASRFWLTFEFRGQLVKNYSQAIFGLGVKVNL